MKTRLNRRQFLACSSAFAAAGATRGYSNSRTCEIGLSTHGGIPYKGLASLVNEAAVGPARSDA